MKPIDGNPFGDEIAEHSQNDVTQMIQKAASVAHELAKLSPTEHAKLLRSIGVHIENAREQLVATACAETALAEGRIGGEITRTTVQFNRFAELVETGEHLKVVIDKANPDYSPAPRPDIRKINQPLGVVAIFAASNFPLAFAVPTGSMVRSARAT